MSGDEYWTVQWFDGRDCSSGEQSYARDRMGLALLDAARYWLAWGRVVTVKERGTVVLQFNSRP